MRLLDFGSLNIDHTYHLPHFVRAGETLSCSDYRRSEGGKGLNQAVALAKAGQPVSMAGAIGEDGRFLLDALSAVGGDHSLVQVLDAPTGHALIQVDASGANCIIVHSGANSRVDSAMIDSVLAHFEPGDYVLLQNEISNVDQIIDRAADRGLQVVLNPSPVSETMKQWPLNRVAWFILNEIEGGDLTGETEPDAMLDAMLRLWPHSHIVLTLGADGAIYADAHCRIRQPAVSATAVDTTAAGDTFTGYFLAEILRSGDVSAAMALAARAASVTITRPGASQSIPLANELELGE